MKAAELFDLSGQVALVTGHQAGSACALPRCSPRMARPWPSWPAGRNGFPPSKARIEQSGGRMTIESRPEVGTTVTLAIPRVQERKA